MANLLGCGITLETKNVSILDSFAAYCHLNSLKNIQLEFLAAYCHLNSLKNIQLEFLSPNTTSLVQPMCMLIITN
jgi:hypothetical protein